MASAQLAAGAPSTLAQPSNAAAEEEQDTPDKPATRSALARGTVSSRVASISSQTLQALGRTVNKTRSGARAKLLLCLHVYRYALCYARLPLVHLCTLSIKWSIKTRHAAVSLLDRLSHAPLKRT